MSRMRKVYPREIGFISSWDGMNDLPRQRSFAGMKKDRLPVSKRFNGFRNTYVDVMRGYCQNATIHGLMYIADKDRPLLERFMWLGALVLSFTASMCMIFSAWRQWEQSPVVIAYNSKLWYSWELPHPAITVCPTNKAKDSVVNMTEMKEQRLNLAVGLKNLYLEYCKKQTFTRLQCEQYIVSNVSAVYEVQPGPYRLYLYWVDIEWANRKYKSFRIYNITEKERQLLDDRALVCRAQEEHSQEPLIRNDTIDNIELMSGRPEGQFPGFKPLLTSQGLCYTSNMLPFNELFPSDTFHGSGRYLNYKKQVTWSLENGYRSGVSGDYPNRLEEVDDGFERHYHFHFESQGMNGKDLCNGEEDNHGYKIAFHNPAVLPSDARQYYMVQGLQELKIIVRPDLITASRELRHLSPGRRNCYFSDEYTLRLFKIYTFENCVAECLSNFTLSSCGCVGFYMPRGLAEREVTDARVVGKYTSACGCLPSCNDIQYQAEYSKQPPSEDNLLDFAGIRHTMEVVPKEKFYNGRQRSELYGTTSFLANCGGLLGLGFGFSILSVVELLYWLCVRSWCKGRRPN